MILKSNASAGWLKPFPLDKKNFSRTCHCAMGRCAFIPITAPPTFALVFPEFFRPDILFLNHSPYSRYHPIRADRSPSSYCLAMDMVVISSDLPARDMHGTQSSLVFASMGQFMDTGPGTQRISHLSDSYNLDGTAMPRVDLCGVRRGLLIGGGGTDI